MVRVVDTSVAVKWFVEEAGRESAVKIFETMVATPGEFAVPELFYFELVHVFNSVVPHPNDGQLRVMENVLGLGIHRFPMSPSFFAKVQKFQRMGLSGYDAAYVSLAEMTGGKWLTFDRKAHQKIARLHLSEILE